MPVDRGYRGGASDYYGTGQSEQRRRDSAEMDQLRAAYQEGKKAAYTEGAAVRVQVGSQRVSGTALANPAGQPTDILLVIGSLIATSPVEQLGYQPHPGTGADRVVFLEASPDRATGLQDECAADPAANSAPRPARGASSPP